MKRPLAYFTFQLAKELKMTRAEIVQKVGAEEMVDWMAFQMTLDPDTKKKLQKEIDLETQNVIDEEERAKQMRSLFMSLGKQKENK